MIYVSEEDTITDEEDTEAEEFSRRRHMTNEGDDVRLFSL